MHELKAHLAAEDGKDGLSMDQGRVAEVVETTVGEDLGASLEPDSLAERDTVLGQDLREDAAESAQHSPASVDDLCLAVTLERLGVSGETSGIPAVVTRELTGQVVGGRAIGVRAEPLCAVRAVELDSCAGSDGALQIRT